MVNGNTHTTTSINLNYNLSQLGEYLHVKKREPNHYILKQKTVVC